MSQIEKPFEERLPFDEAKQNAILGHLLIDEKFFVVAHQKIKPAWFLSIYAQKVYQAQLDFYKEYGRIPSTDELKHSNPFLKEDQGTRSRMNGVIPQAVQFREKYGLDVLSQELTDWLHTRIFHQGIVDSTFQFNKSNFETAYSIVKKCAKDIEETSFVEEAEVDFLNPTALIKGAEVENERALTFGLSLFDKILNPEASEAVALKYNTKSNYTGSLLPGDTTILLAPTNVGKTTCMITIAIHNVLRSKAVLFITHEGRPEDIQIKIWCSMMGLDKRQFLMFDKNEEIFRKVQQQAQILNRFMTYVPMNRAGLNVEEVVSMVNKKQEERIAKYGRGYDLIIDDYPAKLMSSELSGKHNQRRIIDDYVYQQFVQLGLKHKFHILGAIQTNREGSKVNKGQKEDRLLSMEDVMEAWGPMTSATNVISINRGPDLEKKQLLVFYICKSRSSEKGQAIVCRTDYAKATTHSNILGCSAYNADSPPSDQIDELITKYNGQVFDYKEMYRDAA